MWREISCTTKLWIRWQNNFQFCFRRNRGITFIRKRLLRSFHPPVFTRVS
nr:MAG TPA: hypothetical protein [Caudoviricetes sp.]